MLVNVPWKVAEIVTKHGIRPSDGSTPIMAELNQEQGGGDICIANVHCHTKFKRGKANESVCRLRDAHTAIIVEAPAMLLLIQEMVRRNDTATPMPRDAKIWDDAREILARALGEH